LIQRSQLQSQSARMGWLDACFTPFVEKALQPFVPETFDHWKYCSV
jgi:hypothetical protein